MKGESIFAKLGGQMQQQQGDAQPMDAGAGAAPSSAAVTALETRIAQLEQTNAALIQKLSSMEETLRQSALPGTAGLDQYGDPGAEVSRKIAYFEARLAQDGDLVARFSQIVENMARANDARVEELRGQIAALSARSSVEQQLTAALGGVSEKVTGLSKIVDGLNSSAVRIQREAQQKLNEVGNKAASIDSIRDESVFLRRQLEELNRTFTNRLEERIRTASSSILRELEDNMAETKKDITIASAATVEEKLADNSNGIKKRLEEFGAQILRSRDETEARLKRELSAIGQSLKEEYETVARNIKSSVITDLSSRVAATDQHAENLGKTVSIMAEKVSELDSKSARVETIVHSKLTETDLKLSQVSEITANLSDTISREVANTVQRSGADILRCTESIGMLGARLEDLQHRLDGLRDEMNAGLGARTESLEARIGEIQELSNQTIAQVKLMMNSPQGGWEDLLAVPSHVKNMGVELSYVANKLMRVQMRMDEFEARFGQFLVASKQISMERQNFVDYLKAQLGHTANLLTRLEDERNADSQQ